MARGFLNRRLCLAMLAGSTLASVPSVASSQEAAQAVAAPASFTVTAIDVLGVTRLPAGDVERLIYPFLGPDKTNADMEAARKAVQDAYVARGYEATVVEIPPQPVQAFAQGLVQITVNEAPVGSVSVSGAKYHSESRVRRELASVKPGQPLDFKALQTDLGGANRFPDRTINPSFKAGTAPGTIDVDLKVNDNLPVHGSLELNNDNSPNTTRPRLSGSLRYTNLWGLGHSLSANFVTAPRRKRESDVISGSYTAPLMGSPFTLLVYGYTSNSNIAALGGTNVLGDGYQIGGKLLYRLPSQSTFQSFSVGLDYKDFNQKIDLAGQPVSTAPIRYIPLSLGYSYSRSGEKSSLDINLAATLGLRIMKRIGCFDPAQTGCVEDQFTNKEVDSRENFAHINLDATWTRAFKGDWSVQLRGSGQYADSHLVTNEQYALGGVGSVRGYFQSEVVGDEGLAGSFELRTPSLAPRLPSFVDELRAFGFVDGGLVRIINALPGVDDSFDVAGVGGGVRLRLLRFFSGEFAVGVPLINGPDSKRGDPRYTFSVKGEF